MILLVGFLFASPLGILFAGEDTGTEIKIPDAVATLNGEFTDEIYHIMEDNPYDELDMQEGMEATMLQNWRNVLAVYAVKVSTDEEHGLDVMTMDEEKLQLLREIFFDANKLVYELTTSIVDGAKRRSCIFRCKLRTPCRWQMNTASPPSSGKCSKNC